MESLSVFVGELDLERDQRPGAVVCFRDGPEGAHLVAGFLLVQ